MDIDWTKQFEKVSIPYADEFVNNYHYNKRLKVSQIYHVVGWKSKDDFKCYPLDIVNIFKIEQ